MSLEKPASATAGLRAVRDDWRTIAAVAFVVTLGGVAYAVWAPSWYQSQIAVVPQAASKSAGLAAALTADLPLNLDIGGNDSANADRIQAVLKSRTVSDEVIVKFQLKERYHESYMENTRTSLWTHCSTRLDKKPNVVTLTCEDKDPKVAQQMTEYIGEVGNTVFRRISTTTAAEERRFLEKRWDQSKQDVVTASLKLRDFEEKHKLVDLGEQSKAMVSAMASLKAEMLAKQIQLSYLNQFSSSEEATATQLRRQVAILQSKLDSMMETHSGGSDEDSDENPSGSNLPKTSRVKEKDGNGGLFPQAMRVPRLRFELEQLYREKKIQETLYLMLTQRYELARINEARDTSAFQVLDAPIISDRRSRPKRVTIALGALFCGVLLGVGLSLGNRWRRGSNGQPSPVVAA